ncbi:MAG: hypothetical protein M3O31_00675 [Acidobacteriota bacterium]|nr:hypothetical protein [Acidobacteriota bacterium]
MRSENMVGAFDQQRTQVTYADVSANIVAFSGVGLVLGAVEGIHVSGVDIDACCDAATGRFTAESREIVIGLDSYAEFSPSRHRLPRASDWHPTRP